MEGDCGKTSQGIGAKPGTFQNPREERVLRSKENRAFNGVKFYKMEVSIGWATWKLFAIVKRTVSENLQKGTQMGKCYRVSK